MSRKNSIILVLLIVFCFNLRAETNQIKYPDLFQGKMIMHFPLGALPRDTTGTNFFWMPIPEMGFQFNPVVPFVSEEGWWEFPIHIMTFFPFLDKYGALGDIALGAGFQAPPLYKFRLSYRFMAGAFYPVEGTFHGHITEADISLPVEGFSGAGVKFSWVIKFMLDMDKPYQSQDKVYDHYEGGVFAIAPYWKFPLKYGNILLAYRLVLSSQISGRDSQKDYSYQVKTSTVSTFEIDYTYP